MQSFIFWNPQFVYFVEDNESLRAYRLQETSLHHTQLRGKPYTQVLKHAKKQTKTKNITSFK